MESEVATKQITVERFSVVVGLQGRFVGNQFEDDQNVLPLARFFTLDGEVSQRILLT
jgi:hypothetical protein